MPERTRIKSMNIGQYPKLLGLPFALAIILIALLVVTALLSIVFLSWIPLTIDVIYVVLAYRINNKYGVYFIKEMKRKRYSALRASNFIRKIETSIYFPTSK